MTTIKSILHPLASTDGLVIKLISVAGAFLAAHFGQIDKYIVGVFILLVIDMVTGVRASVVKKKERVESRRLYRTVEKFVVYSLAIIASYVVEVIFISGDAIWEKGLTYVAAAIIAAVELRSVYENVSTIVGQDLWEAIKDRVYGMLGVKPK